MDSRPSFSHKPTLACCLVRDLHASRNGSIFARRYRRSSHTASEGDGRSKASALQPPFNMSKGIVAPARIHPSIEQARNLEMLVTCAVYRHDGAPDLGSSIVRLRTTLGHSMKPTKDSLIGGLYPPPSVIASGGALTWRSRCNAGSFQPRKADVIPTRIRPLIQPAISHERLAACG